MQSNQVKLAPAQDSITDFFIRKLNLLVVAATTIKFKSAFLHA